MKNIFPLLSTLLLIAYTFNNTSQAQTPDWKWAQSAGGNSNDRGTSVQTDGSGSVYASGYFYSDSITFGNTTLYNLNPNYTSAFLTKYDPAGNVIWAVNVGGTGSSSDNFLSVDNSGSIYLAGNFGIDTLWFDTVSVSCPYSLKNIYVTKYDSSGHALWARAFGGSDADAVAAVDQDANGNVYIAGDFYSPSIAFGGTTLYNTDSTLSGNDFFVAKLDANGNVLWAKAGAGNQYEEANDIDVDAAGNAYITGSFNDNIISIGGITVLNSTNGTFEVFIAKYNSNGNVIWAKGEGGDDLDEGNAIALDNNGNLFVTGLFWGYTCTFGNITLINSDTDTAFGLASEVYIVKYDTAGNVLWAKSGHGDNIDRAGSIATDASGNAYITGYDRSDIITFDSIVLLNTMNNADIYTVKYNPSGNVVWAVKNGGNYDDFANDIAVDPSGVFYLTGYYQSQVLNFGNNFFTPITGNSGQFFIAKADSALVTGNCSAFFTVYPDVTTPHHWFAQNLATGTPPLTYIWNWGDGQTSTGATPSHVYNNPANYFICVEITDANGCMSTYCDSSTYIFRGNSNLIASINVVISNTNEIDFQNVISIYPNPVSGMCTIDAAGVTNASLSVYDMKGREILKQTFDTRAFINTNDFAKGIYMVSLSDEKGRIVNRKLVKE